jgi:molybdopterin-guanine dinucleotide biosynthesis protein A
MKIDAVLPAGGRISGDLAGESGTHLKALLRFGPDTVLERTLKTLRATGRVRRIAVVGPGEIAGHTEDLADVVLPETGSGAGNILRGMDWVRGAGDGAHLERVLVVTTDLPFLSPDAITGFLDACPPDMEVCVPVLNRQEFEARFARSASRYVRLRDGEWMIGCASLISHRAVTRNQAAIQRVFAARRSHIGMARLLGPVFVLRFLTGRLTLKHVEAKCLQTLGCSGLGVRGCAPELAFDIDYISDYRDAVAHWGQLCP